LEGVRPVGLVGQKPLPRLEVEPSVLRAVLGAVLFEAIERVPKDGNHEPELRCRRPASAEELGRQYDVEIHHLVDFHTSELPWSAEGGTSSLTILLGQAWRSRQI